MSKIYPEKVSMNTISTSLVRLVVTIGIVFVAGVAFLAFLKLIGISN